MVLNKDYLEDNIEKLVDIIRTNPNFDETRLVTRLSILGQGIKGVRGAREVLNFATRYSGRIIYNKMTNSYEISN